MNLNEQKAHEMMRRAFNTERLDIITSTSIKILERVSETRALDIIKDELDHYFDCGGVVMI